MDRKYAMARLRAGEYLLPSNDRSVLWLIRRYEEDGTATRWDEKAGDWRPVLGHFWEYAYTPMPPADTEFDPRAVSWEPWGFCCRTRQEAIDDAMKATPPIKVASCRAER